MLHLPKFANIWNIPIECKWKYSFLLEIITIIIIYCKLEEKVVKLLPWAYRNNRLLIFFYLNNIRPSIGKPHNSMNSRQRGLVEGQPQVKWELTLDCCPLVPRSHSPRLPSWVLAAGLGLLMLLAAGTHCPRHITNKRSTPPPFTRPNCLN